MTIRMVIRSERITRRKVVQPKRRHPFQPNPSTRPTSNDRTKRMVRNRPRRIRIHTTTPMTRKPVERKATRRNRRRNRINHRTRMTTTRRNQQSIKVRLTICSRFDLSLSSLAVLPDDSDDENDGSRNKKKGKGKKGANKAKEDDTERKKPKGGKKGRVSDDDDDDNEVKEAPPKKEAQQGRKKRARPLCIDRIFAWFTAHVELSNASDDDDDDKRSKKKKNKPKKGGKQTATKGNCDIDPRRWSSIIYA